MELNEVQLMAVNISTVLKTILNDRISSSKIYDLVDEPNHHSFKIGSTEKEILRDAMKTYAEDAKNQLEITYVFR